MPSSRKLHPSLPAATFDARFKSVRRTVITSLLLLLIGLFPLSMPVSVAAQGVDCGLSYTVQSGDNFGAIAKHCGVTSDALKAANPQVTNINLIRVGQRLTIPSAMGVGVCGGYTGGLDVVSLRYQVLKDLGVSIPDPDKFDLKVVPLGSRDAPPALIQSWGELSAAPPAIGQHFIAAYTFDPSTACWKELDRVTFPGVNVLTDLQVDQYPQSDRFQMIVGYDRSAGLEHLVFDFDGAKLVLLGGVVPMPETQTETTTPVQPIGVDSCNTTLSLYPSGSPETLLQLIRCEQINDALKEFWDQPFSVEASENYSLQEYSIRFGPGVLEVNSNGRIQIPLLNEGDSVYRIVAFNQLSFGDVSYLVFTVDQNGWHYLGMVEGQAGYGEIDWRIIYGGLDHLWLAASSNYSSAGSSWTYERWYDLQMEQFDNPTAEFVTWTGGTRNDGPIYVQTRGYPQLNHGEDGTLWVVVGYDITANPLDLVLKRHAVYAWDEGTHSFAFDAAKSDVTEDQIAVGFSLASDSEFVRFAFAEIKQGMKSGSMAERAAFRQYLNSITEDSPEKQELLK